MRLERNTALGSFSCSCAWKPFANPNYYRPEGIGGWITHFLFYFCVRPAHGHVSFHKNAINASMVSS